VICFVYARFCHAVELPPALWGRGNRAAGPAGVMPFSEKFTKKALLNCASLQKRKKRLDIYANMRYTVSTKSKGEFKMNEIEIIKDIMKQSTPKITLDVLRDRLGYKTVSGVSDRLSRGKSMKVDTYIQFLDALGYEVVVQPKTARGVREGCYKVGDVE